MNSKPTGFKFNIMAKKKIEIEGVEIRGVLYVDQQTHLAYKEYAKLKKYVDTTKNLTKSELRKHLTKLNKHLTNACNDGEYFD